MPLFTFASADSAVAVRLAVIERKLDAVMQHLGIEEHAEDFSDVCALARCGSKIQAIKLYRTQTGAGLAAAKAFVDQIK